MSEEEQHNLQVTIAALQTCIGFLEDVNIELLTSSGAKCLNEFNNKCNQLRVVRDRISVFLGDPI